MIKHWFIWRSHEIEDRSMRLDQQEIEDRTIRVEAVVTRVDGLTQRIERLEKVWKPRGNGKP